ncbi:MAG: hypothetical protein RMK74_07340 [Myxococcales bacterium]|nr:hypothetical protein [Myxococcales bacterium]
MNGVWVLGITLVAGCGARQASEPEGAHPGWPTEIVTAVGTGPALFLTDEPASPAIGYVSPGVVARVTGAPSGGRIPVRIDGPLKARGWLALERAAAYVIRRGRLAGAPVYLGPNDLVRVRDAAGPGRLLVEASPVLRLGVEPIGPFRGVYPADRLAGREVDPTTAEPPRRGTLRRLPAGQAVPVYDRPGGRLVATIPALEPPLVVHVLRERGSWKGIRAGVGPYLLGYVDVPLAEADADEQRPAGVVGTAAHAGPMPARIAAESGRPLWRVRPRARLRFEGTTIGIFVERGWAREMQRYPTGEVDVFVAADDRLALRGMLRTSDLEQAPAEPGAASPGPLPPPPPATTAHPGTPAPPAATMQDSPTPGTP